ncbi:MULTISPECIES: hypothetical protein [unclassified Streptomyces]|uniref:hypothetical protein n=1 Tax=unclassified Streptomyces TaxID=2593676 RepID=UPI00036251E2|nr:MULTISPECIES: hypothetical protein [unclassified Streptomyces]MYT29437.1 hypothetical protein [Streptomyces sp. SID8354]
MARRPRPVPGRWISAAFVAGLWWWAVCRLVLWPGSAGPVEGAVAAAGWGLSLLPVHCVPWNGRREGARGRGAGRGGVPAAVEARLVEAWWGSAPGRLVEVWRRRRSGEGAERGGRE